MKTKFRYRLIILLTVVALGGGAFSFFRIFRGPPGDCPPGFVGLWGCVFLPGMRDFRWSYEGLVFAEGGRGAAYVDHIGRKKLRWSVSGSSLNLVVDDEPYWYVPLTAFGHIWPSGRKLQEFVPCRKIAYRFEILRLDGTSLEFGNEDGTFQYFRGTSSKQAGP